MSIAGRALLIQWLLWTHHGLAKERIHRTRGPKDMMSHTGILQRALRKCIGKANGDPEEAMIDGAPDEDLTDATGLWVHDNQHREDAP